MESNSIFFSLRWKLAILFVAVFLLLLSVFAYLSYQNAMESFENDRKDIQSNHFNIAETLTNDSFLVLEQFAELVSIVNNPSEEASSLSRHNTISTLDENWARWQIIWDIENIAYYDKQGALVKSWGKQLTDPKDKVRLVITDEAPAHHVFCPDNCYQQAIVPVMGNAEIAGVFSVTHSFSDVIIKYRNATNSDIGVLIPSVGGASQDGIAASATWEYKLSGMTKPEKNQQVFEFIARNYKIDEFLNNSKRIVYGNAEFEVRIMPVQKANANKPPYFFFLDDITDASNSLHTDLKRIWLYSFVGLMASLLLILLALHVSLRRITSLSRALPLLSKNNFDQFRKQISVKDSSNLGYDELDKLSFTALSLADQLEFLEQEMRGYTFSLMEKSQELAQERDFIKQLVELAPVIIIIQKLNGIILTINHAGVEGLETDSQTIIGKVFDVFIPDDDQEHIKKLNRLRTSEYGDQIQLDGQLVTESGKFHDISWIHKFLPSKFSGDEPVILTLGLDISERKIAEARNIRMAYYDFLTGLGNRRKFQEEFTQKLLSAERYGYQLALFYLDLDRFKEINDTSGHEAGDSFLKMVANTLKEAIRSTDLLCRLGGDEFTLLMPHADVSGVEHIAKKINQVLKGLVFQHQDKTYTASTSIGVAIFPMHGKTVSELMAHADLAMYKAKELGRGRHHLFNPDFDYRNKLNQTVYWRNLLEDAINNDKFILFYQPILTIKSNDITHYECLVRLQLDDGKILAPSDFVSRAEELGLIGKVDRIVLKKAVEQHLEFNRQGLNHKLSVNISKRSFEDPAIFDYFAELFKNPEVDQKRIIFEITDTAAISNYQSTNVLINKITDLGCVLALNDFGVEYPSLHYLKNAPVDYVKIDGSLIRQLDKSNDDKIFVKTLIELAQAFGKKTVAEYVENEEILTILKEFGLDYAQGYYIGKPKAME